MSESNIRTGWICIATEGNTADGRIIPAHWLKQMAETYSPDFYTALLWPDHNRKADVMGQVIALKAEQVIGKMKLFAILKPTRELQSLNARGQKRFCSIEPAEDFAGTSKTYLMGVGVTDQPASTGTTQMQFSQGKRLISKSEPLHFSAKAEKVSDAEFQKLIGAVERIAQQQQEFENKLYTAASEARGFYLV
ncbi:GPO family capsid scaffolding protein [Oceanimonas doudoroffii]|uniref:Capsid protein n=1 Tax=Oceanimonas doudoroffii TaxID=84158 RepID=A0A233RJD9_9GAMM|nr:GPO family capsid scaffolding protein [Oceanimonas doudoroffii]OXY83501.1 hypothetical protein B6S08_08460 [Oceanimonas doudoroffii]